MKAEYTITIEEVGGGYKLRSSLAAKHVWVAGISN